MTDSGEQMHERPDPNRNLAARYASLGQPLELVEGDLPCPGEGEVVVRVLYCGVCGTELKMLSDPREGQRNLGFLGFAGHEYSGVVEAVGPGVSNWAKGDQVVGLVVLPCGSCARCLAGDTSNCVNWWRNPERAYARYTTVRAAQLRAIPANVDMRLAALALPLAECLVAVEKAEWKPGQTALVIGGGAIGLLTTALLVHGGASSVILTEPNAERRALAASLGAIAVPPEEALQAVRRLSEEGVDVAFECVGSAETFGTAMSSLRQGGRLALFGLAEPDAVYSLSPRDLLNRGLSIVVAYGSGTTLVRALHLLPVIGAERLLADEFPLTRVNEAFACARSGRPGKVLVAPWSTDSEDRGPASSRASAAA
jgi:L-iditol 2-dehydrogenase